MYSTRTVNDKFALLCLERGKKAGHAPRAHTKGFTAQPVLGVVGRVQGRGDYLHRRYLPRRRVLSRPVGVDLCEPWRPQR